MKLLLDTSFLVALLLEDHVAHERVLGWFQRIVRGECTAVIAAHSIAETYAVLTRLPQARRIATDVTWRAIELNLAHCEVVALDVHEYVGIVGDLAARGIGGGPTYDSLIAAVARKVTADLLLTLNPKHFARVAPDLSTCIQEP